MPKVVGKPFNGMVRVEMEDGQVYDVPDYMAESMGATDDSTIFSQGENQVPVTPESQANPFAPEGQYVFGVEPQLGDAGVLPPPQVAPPQLTPMAPQGGSQSGSVSMRYKGIPGPYPRVPTAEETFEPVGYALQQQSQTMGREAAAQEAYDMYGHNPEDQYKYSDIQKGRAETAEQVGQMDQRLQQDMMKYEQRIADARAAIPSMDRGRIWKNMSTGEQVMGIAGAFIAGFLHPDQPNEVVAQMMRMVDQDMEAQRVDIDTKRYDVLGMERGYERAAQRGALERSRFLEARAAKIEAIQYGLDMEKAKLTSPINKAKIETLQAQLGVIGAKAWGDAAQQEFTNRVQVKKLQQEDVQLRIAAANAAANRARAGGKTDKPDDNGVIYLRDPQNPKLSVKVRVDPGVWKNQTEPVKTAWLNTVGGTENKIRAVDRYINAVGAAESFYGGPLSKYWNQLKSDPKAADLYNEYISAYNGLLEVRAFETGGKTLTPNEKEVFTAGQGSIDTWTSKGGADKIAPKLRDELIADRAVALSHMGATYERQAPYPLIDENLQYRGQTQFPNETSFQPGIAQELTAATLPPAPDPGAEKDASSVGWRTWSLAIKDDVNRVKQARGVERDTAVEQLQGRVQSFIDDLNQGNVVYGPGFKPQLESIENALETLSPADRTVTKNPFRQILGEREFEENYLGLGPVGKVSVKVDALDVLQDFKAKQDLEFEKTQQFEDTFDYPGGQVLKPFFTPE